MSTTKLTATEQDIKDNLVKMYEEMVRYMANIDGKVLIALDSTQRGLGYLIYSNIFDSGTVRGAASITREFNECAQSNPSYGKKHIDAINAANNAIQATVL